MDIKTIVYEGEFVEEDNPEVRKFSQLGDALRYGFTQELPRVIRNNGDGKMLHFYASIAYMSLFEYCNSEKCNLIARIVYMESQGEDSVNSVVQNISRVLCVELKRHFCFNSFEELMEQLNSITIPHWVFCIADSMASHFCFHNYVFYNEELYFIGQREHDTDVSLLKVRVENLNPYEELIKTFGINGLASGFNQILGFDKTLLRVYLKLYDQANFYAYYDICDDKIVICRNRFHSFVDGNLFVITKDNQLAVVTGELLNNIKEYKDNEVYVVDDGFFLIKPDEGYGRFFVPYKLFFDGRILPADKDDYDFVLWNFISKAMDKVENVSRMFLIGDKGRIPKPSRLSIAKIIEELENDIPIEDRCRAKKYILFKSILDELEKYVDKNTDISSILYALCEAHTVLTPIDREFPNEMLYWRLKEVERNSDSSKALGSLLQSHNYTKLVEVLIENPIPIEEVRQNNDIEFTYENMFLTKRQFNLPSYKIGTFSVDGDEVISLNAVPLEDGMFLGCQCIPRVDYRDETGIVTYDARTCMSYITCESDISEKAKLQIIKDFSLEENRIMIIKQGKPEGDKRNMYMINKKWDDDFFDLSLIDDDLTDDESGTSRIDPEDMKKFFNHFILGEGEIPDKED